MSGIVVFESSQRVTMLTDLSLYQPDGTIVAFEPKAFPVDSWDGAISGRGDRAGINVALDLAERYGSFDEFVARSAPEIERWHRAATALAGGGQTVIEIHVIGWSELADRPRAFVLCSPIECHTDETAYVWRGHDAEDGCFYHAMGATELWRLHRQGAEPRVDFDAETFDPIRHGIPLMEAMRRGRGDAAYGSNIAGRHLVGGAVVLTVVDRDGARQGMIHGWPDDTVGEPIQPAPFDDAKWPKIMPMDLGPAWTFERFMRALKNGAIDPETFALDRARLAVIEATAAESTGGLSRQQRRAAAAQAKKGRAHAA
ncbi:hypothetical protein [Methylobacterium sp. AMS5]|uniref:hypothetical protein n=1 Tax=Methylobacterium sp. AMS5 TaxID=925818 RepID=UPI00074F8638|nr:hypothetical protein [Methylobacterium sp. AMS5]AMB48420.1 hypothetical protein Y590_25950 [Methylobacterium sp. AMS5]